MKTSNKVEVEIKPPEFEVIKEQRIKGEASFTKAKLKAEVGETVEYKITVKKDGSDVREIRSDQRRELARTSRRRSERSNARARCGKGVHVRTRAHRSGQACLQERRGTAKGGEKKRKRNAARGSRSRASPNSKSRRSSGSLGKLGCTEAELCLRKLGKKVEYLVTVKNTGEHDARNSRRPRRREMRRGQHQPGWANRPLKAGASESIHARTRAGGGRQAGLRRTAASIAGGGSKR